MAETIAAVDSRDPTGDPTKWSAGLARGLSVSLAAAVNASCWVPSQLVIQMALRCSSASRSLVVTT